MKKLLIIATLTLFTFHLSAQRIEVHGYLQETIMGTQKGYSLRMAATNRLKIGAFYQSTYHLEFENKEGNYSYKGLEAVFPLKSCGNLTFNAVAKVGLVNSDFLIVTPEIETTWHLTRHIGVAVGAGVRAREAAISAKAIIKLF